MTPNADSRSLLDWRRWLSRVSMPRPEGCMMSHSTYGWPDPRKIERGHRRETVGESVDDHFYAVDVPAEIREYLDAISGLVNSDDRVNAGWRPHLFGWRCHSKSPSVDACVGFQCNPKHRVLLETEPLGKTGLVDRLGSSVYYMQASMLVQVVKLVDIENHGAQLSDMGFRPSGIAGRSVIRLQPLDRCSFAASKRRDLLPMIGHLPLPCRSPSPSTELGLTRNTRGDLPFPASLMKLENQMVKGRPEIVIGLSQQKRPPGREWFEFTNEKAIFQPAAMTLHRDGQELTVNPPMEFIFECSVVLSGPTHTGYWTLQAATHDGDDL